MGDVSPPTILGRVFESQKFTTNNFHSKTTFPIFDNIATIMHLTNFHGSYLNNFLIIGTDIDKFVFE